MLSPAVSRRRRSTAVTVPDHEEQRRNRDDIHQGIQKRYRVVGVQHAWKNANPASHTADQCSSKGVWETEAEQEIKARAEGH